MYLSVNYDLVKFVFLNFGVSWLNFCLLKPLHMEHLKHFSIWEPTASILCVLWVPSMRFNKWNAFLTNMLTMTVKSLSRRTFLNPFAAIFICWSLEKLCDMTIRVRNSIITSPSNVRNFQNNTLTCHKYIAERSHCAVAWFCNQMLFTLLTVLFDLGMTGCCIVTSTSANCKLFAVSLHSTNRILQLKLSMAKI